MTLTAAAPLTRKHRDFGEFLKVLRREGKPRYLPFFELFASPGFIAQRMGVPFDQMSPDAPGYWQLYVDFWMGLGFDCVPMEIPLSCPLAPTEHAASRGSESTAVIQTMEDFERYPWPDEAQPIEFRYFEQVSALLPEGIKIIGGVGGGPYEWATYLMGVSGLAMALFTDPELVDALFAKLARLHVSGARQLAQMDGIGAVRQGDDLGFKTSTFLAPDVLRRLVFPIYKQMVQFAHDQNKPFILHSCGNLAEVYEDLIEECKIDAKHSYEDTILPVSEFKRRYGQRITPIGGLDVDKICRSDEAELRRYAREMIEKCFGDGYWALGTGNSLADYIPVENYLIVLDEGIRVAGK